MATTADRLSDPRCNDGPVAVQDIPRSDPGVAPRAVLGTGANGLTDAVHLVTGDALSTARHVLRRVRRRLLRRVAHRLRAVGALMPPRTVAVEPAALMLRPVLNVRSRARGARQPPDKSPPFARSRTVPGGGRPPGTSAAEPPGALRRTVIAP